MADDVALAEPEVEAPVAGQADAPEQEEAPEAILEADGAGDGTADVEPEPADEPAEPIDPEALIAANPHVRDWLDAKFRERENAAAQREKARLEREAGSRERTRAATLDLLHAIDPELDPDEVVGHVGERGVKRADYQYELAYGHAALDLATKLPDLLMGEYRIPVDVREAAVALREQGDATEYVRTLIKGAVDSELAKAREGDEKRIKAEVAKRTADELKAARIEAQPKREAAPPVPRGGGDGRTITTQQYAAGSSADRERWRAEHFVTVAADGTQVVL